MPERHRHPSGPVQHGNSIATVRTLLHGNLWSSRRASRIMRGSFAGLRSTLSHAATRLHGSFFCAAAQKQPPGGPGSSFSRSGFAVRQCVEATHQLATSPPRMSANADRLRDPIVFNQVLDLTATDLQQLRYITFREQLWNHWTGNLRHLAALSFRVSCDVFAAFAGRTHSNKGTDDANSNLTAFHAL